MTKLIINGQNKVNELMEVIRDRVSNNNGFTTLEWILIIIVVAGALVALKAPIQATFVKVAGLFDTIISDKVNAVK
jgi:uncharacterized Rmd1/YagE family protein